MNRRRLLAIPLAAMLCVAAPAATVATVSLMGVEEQVEEQQPVINVDANSVTVQGATGMVLEVVSLTGRAVATHKIESPAQRIELNLPKGCYILKVGKVVRKVTVR